MADPTAQQNPIDTAPVFAPDGNVRQIPYQQLRDALNNGGKLAVQMKAPNGDVHYVPHDQIGAAAQAGGQVNSEQGTIAAPKPQEGFWHSLGSLFGLTPESMAAVNQQAAQHPWQSIADAADPLKVPKAMVQSAVNNAPGLFKKTYGEAKAADDAATHGDIKAFLAHQVGGMGYTAATLASPVLGDAPAKAGEQFGAGNIKGGMGTTVGLVGPFLFGEAAKQAPGVANTAAEALDASAKSDLGKVLAPTKQATKFIAKEKVIPGMQERGITARSAPALQEQAASKMDSLGQQIDDAYDAQPVQPSIPTKPIIDKLEAYKKNFVNDVPALGDQPAKSVVLNPDAIDRIQAIQDKIAEHGDALDPQTMRTLRQFFDENVADGKGYAGKTMAEGHSLEVQKQAANAIRGQLADTVPGLSDLNSEFSFWKNLNDVLEQTAQRRTGQMGGGLGRKIATGTGAAVGAAAGHAFGGGPLATETGAAIGGATANALSRIVNSTAWNTVSAKMKTGLANALATKDPAAINQAVSSIQAATSKQPAKSQPVSIPATPSGETPQSAPQTVPAFLRGSQQPAESAPAVQPRGLSDILKASPERRQAAGADLRSILEDAKGKLSPEESTNAIFTDEKSGMPNAKAFNIAQPQLAATHPHVGFADIDGFKEVNTQLGEPTVDKTVFPAVGDAMRSAIAKENGAVHGFHVHGDEFQFLGSDPAAISRVVDRVNGQLANSKFTVKNPDGTMAQETPSKLQALLKRSTNKPAKQPASAPATVTRHKIQLPKFPPGSKLISIRMPNGRVYGELPTNKIQ